jgi:glycosyltransferase involved in cell wall biosynthesis
LSSRVTSDGKFFTVGGDRFAFRGVTYGTFQPREDGELFPERDAIKRDFAEMSAAGFTVVRTYTAPPDDVIDIAADWGLRVLAGVFYPDWRYLVGTSKRQRRSIAREARAEVRKTSRRLAGNDQIVALCVGNEIPADTVRWVGADEIATAIAGLTEVAREEDPELLVTYGNYPTTEYLPLPSLDFLTFNVFLEDQVAFRRYLTRLHHIAGDRPLVLGEMGLHAEDEARQAEVIDWQMATALERGVAGVCLFSWTDEWAVAGHAVEGWKFGLTRANRSARPALGVATRWNHRTVADLDYDWPTITVVICAHNAAATLAETLTRTSVLAYPSLDIVVVDDGSTDATASIARAHSRVRLVQIPHSGLSAARNAGLRAATGDLVAFLDADAYPSAEWPYYIALGVAAPNLVGAGGPNFPPTSDPLPAHQIARAPGGPVHVLLSDDRAEHVPGCNMAFWKGALEEVGGFDPVYTAAGDDVDLCWKMLDREWEIGFHPAAFIWHHSRSDWRGYLRQQRIYGRSEALLKTRHPDRFTPLGTAHWRGRIYDSFTPTFSGQSVYRGAFGSSAYQSVYGAGGNGVVLAHQAGIPAAIAALAMGPLAVLKPAFLIPALVALVFLLALGAIDMARARVPPGLRAGALGFRAGVAALHLIQPVVRLWGRWHAGRTARRKLPKRVSLPGPVRRLRNGVVLLPSEGTRVELTQAVIADLRSAGMNIEVGTGWEDYDALLLGSALLSGELITSGFPEGAVQLRVRRTLRPLNTMITLLAAIAAWLLSPAAAFAVAAVAVLEVARGIWRTGPLVRRVVTRATDDAISTSG